MPGVAPVGCSVIAYNYMNVDMQEAAHGRAAAVATGIGFLYTHLWAVNTAYLLPGVVLKGFLAALVTALVLGLVNAIIRPILILLTLPLNILTLGLFTLVINALLIMLAAAMRVIELRRDFWPLSVREVHYALLSDPPLRHASKPNSIYTNDLESYKNLVDLLARARIFGKIPGLRSPMKRDR